MTPAAPAARSARAPFTLGRRGGFAATAYAFALTMAGTTLPTPLYPLYVAEFHLSPLIETVVFATYAGGVIGALLLFGHLSDEIGRRRALLPGLALSALSGIVFLLAHGLDALLVGRALSGLSAGMFTGTATATLVDLAPDASRRWATRVATTVNMVGLGLGALLAGVLSEFAASPLRLTFWVQLALLVPAVAFVWAMPEPVDTAGRARVRLQRLRVPLETRPVFLRAALAAFAGFAVLGFFTAVAPGFLGAVLGIDNRATVGLVVFVVFAGSAAGQTVPDRLVRSRALVAGCAGLIAGMGLIALGLALSSLGPLVAGGVVAGVGHGLSFRRGMAMVTEGAPPEARAEVASSLFVVAYVAIAVPVVGLGALAQLVGLQAAALTFAAMVAALAATVLVILVRDASRVGAAV